MKQKNPAIRWTILISVNVLIITAVLMASYFYYLDQSDFRYRTAKNNFSLTVSAMEQVAYGYLRSAQTFCDNWASFITGHNMDMDAAAQFACDINTDPEIMCHIIDYDTLEGIATNENRTPVSYQAMSVHIKNLIEEVENCSDPAGHRHITRAFVNPVNYTYSIGFCHNITLADGKNYLLIRVVPVTAIQARWVFPTGYDSAELIMIDSDGEYVIPSASVGGTNFFEFLGECNNFSQEQVDELRVNMIWGDIAYDLRNADGEASFYSCHQVDFNSDWILIGYIPKSDVKITPVDLTIVTIVIIGFFVLILFDGAFIYVVNKRLRAAMDEARLANEAKTKFLSSMSHDIRTPMNAITGMTAIAAKRIDDKEQVEECLRKITLASNHLLTLINDILDISKVESGKLSLNPMVFSLAELMNNIINIAQSNVKEKALNFDVHVRNITYEYLYADELRVNQIFINLLSNAVKYTHPEGRVLVELEEFPSDKAPNMVTLKYTVADTGIGMSEEYMKTMYTPFNREKNSRVSSIQGTGLGLAITKQMVDLMEGTIEAESKLGEGTTFVVTLDIPIAEKMTDDLMLPPLRLLIADDDPDFLDSAKDTFKSLGVDADLAEGGAKAVEMVSEKHQSGADYRCVILDWKMPDMDGVAATRAIREKVGEDVTVIIVSSYDWTEIEEEALAAGANGFINKPLFRSGVYSKLNELLKFDDNASAVPEDSNDDLKGLNILIAEDNDVNWDIIQVMLEFCGITCERAENGAECLDMLNSAEERKYQAILMDVQMPIMDGREAARNIRKSDKEWIRDIPIVAMTADAFAEDIAACLDAGMDGHVPKPLDMKKLLRELRSALNKNEELRMKN